MLQQLRALLGLEKTEENFAEIWHFFECRDRNKVELDPDDLLAAVHYACEHLEDWPSDMRRIRQSSLFVKPKPHWLLLHGLILSRSALSGKDIEAIANSPYVANIRILDLFSNIIDDDGAIAIAKSKHFKSLNWLCLAANQIGDKGAIALANSPMVQQLLDLDLSNNRVDNDGVLALANFSRCRKQSHHQVIMV